MFAADYRGKESHCRGDFGGWVLSGWSQDLRARFTPRVWWESVCQSFCLPNMLLLLHKLRNLKKGWKVLRSHSRAGEQKLIIELCESWHCGGFVHRKSSPTARLRLIVDEILKISWQRSYHWYVSKIFWKADIHCGLRWVWYPGVWCQQAGKKNLLQLVDNH